MPALSPPQTKGKVELSVHYVANSFCYALVTRRELEGEPVDLQLRKALYDSQCR